MSNFICALTECLDKERVRCVKRVFNKCRKTEARGEFWCFWCGMRYRLLLGFPNPDRYENKEHFKSILRERPCEEYLSKLEEAYPVLKGTLRLQLVRKTEVEDDFDRAFLSLDRPKLYAMILPEVLQEDAYGSCDIFKGNVVNIIRDDILGDSLTDHRVRLVSEILQNVVNRSGAISTGAENILNFHVTHKQATTESQDRFIFVEKVKCFDTDGTPVTSIDGCLRRFSEELALMSEHHLSDESDIAANSQQALEQASFVFAFINGHISSKPVTLKLDENITPFCKGAVFVLYNYCRMAHIIYKYKTLVSSETYPPLPDFEAIDFSLLTQPEEWCMMYEYVIWWPKIFESVVSDLKQSNFRIHKVLEFLKSMATEFSAYYRRTRILTEARPNLLPVLQARIYLVLALMKVYKMALDILGLQPVRNM